MGLASPAAASIGDVDSVLMVLRRLVAGLDSRDLTRRIKRGLLRAPVVSRAVLAFDRRRLDRLERDGDAAERSKIRWREAPPGPGLTWGVELAGDPVVAAAEAHGVFGPGRTVLEIGPGYGRVIRACIERGTAFGRYIGLDISEENAKYLREVIDDPRIEIMHGDAESVSLAEPVDSVLSFLTFKHLYPSFEGALANLQPQLRSGATVMFDLMEGSRRLFERDQATFLRQYSRSEIAEILGRIPLELVAFDRIEHAPGRVRLLFVARNPV